MPPPPLAEQGRLVGVLGEVALRPGQGPHPLLDVPLQAPAHRLGHPLRPAVGGVDGAHGLVRVPVRLRPAQQPHQGRRGLR
jgi:hypothetical protein